MIRKNLLVLTIFIFIIGCASLPIREEVKEDRSLPVGKIEGNTFEGIRFPFKVSLPSAQWKFSLEIPAFMEELGFKRPGLEESELFIFNPVTKSNIQIDLTPAGRRARFNQRVIEGITATAYNGLVEELKMDHGRDFKIEGSHPAPYPLKGVQYSAHQFVKYQVGDTKTIHGWIYGFTEPYQIFIIYMVIEKEGFDDLNEIQRILDSFEIFRPKGLN